MRPLVATGGVVVSGVNAGELETALNAACEKYGFPPGEEFKWSPGRNDWMRSELVGEKRAAFLVEVLDLARQAEAAALVMLSETGCNPFTRTAPSARFDTTVLFLERIHNHMTDCGSLAIVIVDRPGGGAREDTQFLTDCQTLLTRGTRYVDLGRIPINVTTTQSNLVRLLQLADVVTSCTTAYVAGESAYAPGIFEHILPMVRREYDCYGGRGIKIHPDFRYRNLYHWLLGDTHYVRYQGGSLLPDQNRLYASGPDSP